VQVQDPDDFGHCIWSRRLKKSKIEESQRFQEVEDWRSQRFQEVKDWRNQKIKEVKDLKFGDSTRVCNSNWVSGATDEGMPFRYPRISIPGLAH
jgi:hypothetical protein